MRWTTVGKPAASTATLGSQPSASAAADRRVGREVGVGSHPAVGLDKIEREGRGDEDLGEQRIGIERDRPEQRVEIRSVEEPVGSNIAFDGRAGWRRAVLTQGGPGHGHRGSTGKQPA